MENVVLRAAIFRNLRRVRTLVRVQPVCVQVIASTTFTKTIIRMSLAYSIPQSCTTVRCFSSLQSIE